MKPRPVDECLAASSLIIAKTRSKLVELQFSLDSCLTRVEISAGAVAASQALLAKLNGGAPAAVNGADIDPYTLLSEQTSDTSPPTSDELVRNRLTNRPVA